MQVLGPGDQPFLTQDNILAYALYLAFTAFCDDEMPCVNFYRPDDLRQFGYRGLRPQEAALKAVEDGRKGSVQYMFVSPRGDLIQAFEDQKKIISDGEGFARDVIKNLVEDYRIGARSYEEMIVRLVCTFVYMRAEFITMWRKLEPLLRFDDNTESMTKNADGSHVVSYGGFKFIGARANNETRQHLGL
jgi:hypothetical protein